MVKVGQHCVFFVYVGAHAIRLISVYDSLTRCLEAFSMS
jgi:hypothetical protein